jgi:hypothetical protein
MSSRGSAPRSDTALRRDAPRRPTRRIISLVGLSVCVAIAGVADHLRTRLALPAGLTGQYFSNDAWQGTPVAIRVDQDLEETAVRADWPGEQPEQFSVDWSGALLILTSGSYIFSTTSDDGSVVLVDDHLVVDNGGVHARRAVSGAVTLTSGWHHLTIRYFKHTRGRELSVTWTPPGSGEQGLPVWRLRPQLRSRHLLAQAVRVDVIWWIAVVTAELWVLAIVVSLAVKPVVRRVHEVFRLSHPGLPWVVAVAAVIDVVGIGWGLPARWAGDEIQPDKVIGGVTSGFAHGWLSVYPPLHFAVLALVDSPIRFLEWIGALTWTGWTPVGLAVLNRLVSVAMAAIILIAVADVARLLFDRRAGLFSAMLLALNVVFVYYTRTSNVDVPYLCWFALALCCYVRVLRDGGTADYVWLGVLAALSVTTKDQAYGLFLLMPFPIGAAEWRRARQRGASSPWRHVLPPRAWLAFAACALTFALGENLVAWPTFVAHVKLITGPASRPYQVFPRTLSGYAALSGRILTLVKRSYGWPTLVVTLCGVVLSAFRPTFRRALIWLTVPAVSYALFFLLVVSYNYDRFDLPLCLLLAPFGGLAIDQAVGRWRPAALGAVVALATYGLVSVLTLDLLTWCDSRYAVRAWLEEQRRPADAIGVFQPTYVLPALRDFNPINIDTTATLRPGAFDWIVVNADYARASPGDVGETQTLDLLRAGQSGYRRVLLARTPVPWAWVPGLSWDLVGPRDELESLSILRDVNPTIEVFQRDGYHASLESHR